MQMHDVHLRQGWRCIPEVSVSEIRKNRMPDRNVRHFLIQETADAACGGYEAHFFQKRR